MDRLPPPTSINGFSQLPGMSSTEYWPTEPTTHHTRRATDRYPAPATHKQPDGNIASFPGIGQTFLSSSGIQNIIDQSERLRAAVNQWRNYAFSLEDRIKDLSRQTKPASAVRTTPRTSPLHSLRGPFLVPRLKFPFDVTRSDILVHIRG